MADTRVSWRHGVLRVDGGGWVLEDIGSTNGTFVGVQRVNRVPISGDCVVRLGNPDDGPVLRCMPQAAAAPPGAGVRRAAVDRPPRPTARTPNGQHRRPGSPRRASCPRRTAPARAVPRDPIPQAPPRPPANPGGPTPPATPAARRRRRRRPRNAAQRRPPSDLADAAARQGPAHRPHPRQRPGPVRPRRLAPSRRTAQVALRDLRDRRPRQPQRHVRERPADVLRGDRRGRHRQHRALDVPAGRRRTAGVRRRRRGHLHRPGPGREGRRRQGAARPRHASRSPRSACSASSARAARASPRCSAR